MWRINATMIWTCTEPHPPVVRPHSDLMLTSTLRSKLQSSLSTFSCFTRGKTLVSSCYDRMKRRWNMTNLLQSSFIILTQDAFNAKAIMWNCLYLWNAMEGFVFGGGGEKRHQGLMVIRIWEQDHRRLSKYCPKMLSLTPSPFSTYNLWMSSKSLKNLTVYVTLCHLFLNVNNQHSKMIWLAICGVKAKHWFVSQLFIVSIFLAWRSSSPCIRNLALPQKMIFIPSIPLLSAWKLLLLVFQLAPISIIQILCMSVRHNFPH